MQRNKCEIKHFYLLRDGLDSVIKANTVLIHHPQSFLEGLLKASTNRHHLPCQQKWRLRSPNSGLQTETSTWSPPLTDTLHGAADLGGNPEELAEIPAGYLHNTVVQTRLKVGRCRVGNRVPTKIHL